MTAARRFDCGRPVDRVVSRCVLVWPCPCRRYHVVHHQYAGAHWTKYVNLYDKHMDGYKACVPSVFVGKNLFEVYGVIAANDWDELANIFYGPLNPGLTKEELILVLKKRLRSSGKKLAAKVGRTQRAKGDDVQYSF